jgi:type I pullulanase
MRAKTPQDWKQLFESEAFQKEKTYGGPLGADYAPAGTTLRLWAPTAQRAEVRLYRTGSSGEASAVLPMQPGAQGLWTCFLPGERAGSYYTYVVTVDGIARETCDPYARAVGLNGGRSMILSPEMAAPEGWAEDARPKIPSENRVIWEVNVRDFSSDPAAGVRMSCRGRYTAFGCENTTLEQDGTHPTCLAHLKRLGIRYVQLMPVYDFGSVDESHSSPEKYNWGYDPVNFNVPDGSYCSDPCRGEVRVRELKELVASLHKAGIGVVMDVVYNHMYRWDNPLNDTAPYYFFRQKADGTPSNGSGCGNETASERPMCRRYIVDSLVYWAKEYHLDGFRFDLMGLLDVGTMNAARAALDALPGGESILMYGEPWQGGESTISAPPADRGSLGALSPRIGIFCDGTRDAIKGSCFDARQPGYVSGRWENSWDIGASVAAWCRSDKLHPQGPGQIISYVSAHDNFTLWDKLLRVRYEKPDYISRDEAALAQNRLTAGIYFTCLGTPFLQAGEEFARTKRGEGNSYNAPLALNRLDWSRAAQFHDLVDFYRGLIRIRGMFPRLSCPDRSAADAITFFALEQPLVGWTLPAAPGDGSRWQALAVYYNPLENERQITLPEGSWQLLCDGTLADLWESGRPACAGSVTLAPVSATIFGKVQG